MSAGVRWPIKDELFSRQVVPCTMEKSTERCAALMPTGHHLHNLFAIILLWSYPNHPDQLWDQFKVNICDDLHPRLIAGGRLDPTDEDIFDYGLHLLNKILMKSHKSLELNFPSMPTPQQQWDILHGNAI